MKSLATIISPHSISRIKILSTLFLFICISSSILSQNHLSFINSIDNGPIVDNSIHEYPSCVINSNENNIISYGVDVTNGNLIFKETDFSWNQFEGEFKFYRTYNNNSSIISNFGKKWSHNFNVFIEFKSDKVLILHDNDDKKLTFNRLRKTRSYITKNTSDTIVITGDSKFILKSSFDNKFEFNNFGYLSKITDSNNNSTHLLYNSDKKLQVIIDPVGRKLIFMYNKNGMIFTITGPNGGMTIYTYYENNTLSSVHYPDGSSRNYFYDEENRLSELRDLNTALFRYKYSKSGKIRSIIDPLENSEYFDFKNFPNDKCIYIDPDSREWVYFTSNNRIDKSIFPDGTKYYFTWNNKRQLIKQVSNNDMTIDYIYINNNLNQIKYSDNRLTTILYDNNNNIVYYKSDYDEYKYTYDTLNQLIEKVDIGNMITEKYSRNLWGLVSKVEINGKKYNIYYDTYGNILKIKSPYGMEVFKYDNMGNMISCSDTLNNIFTASYDVMNRITKISFSDKNIFDLKYDKAGNLIEITGFEGKTYTYYFDKINRLVEEDSGSKQYIYYEKSGIPISQNLNNRLLNNLVNKKLLNQSDLRLSLYRHPLYNISEQIKTGNIKINIPIRNSKRITKHKINDDWEIFYNL